MTDTVYADVLVDTVDGQSRHLRFELTHRAAELVRTAPDGVSVRGLAIVDFIQRVNDVGRDVIVLGVDTGGDVVPIGLVVRNVVCFRVTAVYLPDAPK